MSDTPRTDELYGAKAHEERRVGHGTERLCRELERENATLRAAFRWFRKYPEFVPNMGDHGERVNADIAKARTLFTD